MPTYLISNTIHSSALIWGVDIGSYRFETDNTHREFAVYATRALVANSLEEALETFNTDIAPLLDAVSLNRLSAMSMYGTSTMAVREDMKIAWVRTMKPRKGTGMSLYTALAPDQIKDIDALSNAKDPALNYFRLALLSENVVAGVLHFIQAFESLAGKHLSPTRCNSCKKSPVICKDCDAEQLRPPNTDHAALKAILGKDMYKFFYVAQNTTNNSLRNMLMHGESIIDGFELADRYTELEKALINALVTKYSLTTLPTIDDVRTLTTYESFKTLITYSKPLPPLPSLVKLMHEYQVISGSDPGLADESFFDKFRGVE